MVQVQAMPPQLAHHCCISLADDSSDCLLLVYYIGNCIFPFPAALTSLNAMILPLDLSKPKIWHLLIIRIVFRRQVLVDSDTSCLQLIVELASI